MRTGTGSCIVIGIALLCASNAMAMDPAVKCQTTKLKLAAKYGACRFKAEADAAKRFTAPSFSDCDASFSRGWEKAEARAVAQGAPCWTTGDGPAVQNAVSAHTAALAEALRGSP